MQTPSPRDRLEATLRGVAGEPLVILIAGHPDPDAIGSALAHQRICLHLGVPATIAHLFDVSHRQNRALVKLLNVDLVPIRDRADLSRFRHLSLVDAGAPDPGIELPAELRILTIVDHHRATALDAPFVDVRTHMGASCSIYAEYLSQGLAPLEAQRWEDMRVATALLFGIQTDTDDFALATAADFAAAAYVKARADVDVLKRIGRRTVGATAMNVIARALDQLVVVRDFAVAGVGFVDPADRDTIGGAADFILQREDIDTVLVFGIVGDRIDGSLRTNSPSVDPERFLARAFGAAPDGTPYGGGRADKGGFRIPLGILVEGDHPKALWQLAESVIRSRLSRVVPELQGDASAPPIKRTKGLLDEP